MKNLYSLKRTALYAMLGAAEAKGVVNGVAGICIRKDGADTTSVMWKQIGRIDRDPREGETMAQATNYLLGGLAKYAQSVRTGMNSGQQVGDPKRGENNLRGCLIEKIGQYTVWTFFSGHPDQDEDNVIADLGKDVIRQALLE